MEEMQEALRGKDHVDSRVSMMSVRGYDFSTDSLDDQALREDALSSNRDSSTIISEFSSTKTLMNIDEDSKRIFEDITDSTKALKSFYLTQQSTENLIDQQKESKVKENKNIDKKEKTTGIKKQLSLKETRSKDKSTSKSKSPLRSPSPGLQRSDEKSKTIPRSKRDLFGNAKSNLSVRKSSSTSVKKFSPLSSPSSSPSPSPISRSPSPRKISSAKLTSETKSTTKIQRIERTCTRSTRIRTPPPQSPSPTRAKRPRTLESRETSQSPSPTRKRQTVISSAKESSKTERELLERSSSKSQKKLKIELDFDEYPPVVQEREDQEEEEQKQDNSHSLSPETYRRLADRRLCAGYIQVPAPSFYLSPIEENSETSSSSSRSRREDIKHMQFSSLKEESSMTAVANSDNQSLEKQQQQRECQDNYFSSQKYHTYPKSRIPILSKSNEKKLKMMDPRMYPLEPREVDLDAFQQLHTANSQEELQEFLLLESQCSGTMGLASDMSQSEVYYHDDQSEDERGTMSGSFGFY